MLNLCIYFLQPKLGTSKITLFAFWIQSALQTRFFTHIYMRVYNYINIFKNKSDAKECRGVSHSRLVISANN